MLALPKGLTYKISQLEILMVFSLSLAITYYVALGSGVLW